MNWINLELSFWRKLSVIPQVEMQNGWLRKEERRNKRTMDSYREDPMTYTEDYRYTPHIQKTPKMSRMLKSNPDPAIGKRR